MKYCLIFLIFSACTLFSNEILLEGKISYYRPTDSTTRDIMGHGALFGLETSFQAYEGLYPWLSVSILPNSGHSQGENNKTSMYFVPIGIGLKYLFTIRPTYRVYLGAGMLPAYLHTRDRGPVERVRTKWGIDKGNPIIFSRFLRRVFMDRDEVFRYPYHEWEKGRFKRCLYWGSCGL